MKLITFANGKKNLKLTHKEWLDIGKKKRWTITAHGRPKEVTIAVWNKYIDGLNNLKGYTAGENDVLYRELEKQINFLKSFTEQLINNYYEKTPEHGHEHED